MHKFITNLVLYIAKGYEAMFGVVLLCARTTKSSFQIEGN
jgi:hypothetical protein